MKILITALAMFALRFWWEAHPGIYPCILFWITAAIYVVVTYNATKTSFQSSCILFMAAGFALNAAVTISNGGFMPVSQIIDNYSLWVMATEEHNLLFLADNYAGYSIGDFVVLSGIVLFTVSLMIPIFQEYSKQEVT